MEVILLEKIPHLGDLGSKVNVKPGFARNFLVPRGKAQAATKKNLADFEVRRVELEKIAKERLDKNVAYAEALSGVVVTITANAGHEGRLFGSVGTHEIARALTEAGYAISKQEVKLPTGPLRQTGEYEINLHLQGGDVVAQVKVLITPEV